MIPKSHPSLMVLLVCLILAGLFLVVVIVAPHRPPFIVIDADTEFVGYRVVRTGLANIPASNAEIRSNLPDSCLPLSPGGRFTGIVAPAERTLVRYRIAGSTIVADFQQTNGPVGRLITQDKGGCQLGAKLVIAFDRGDDNGIGSRPLPIAGPAEIGIELGEPLTPGQADDCGNNGACEPMREIGFLRSGSVKVFGRALLSRNDIYLYSWDNSEFPLPAGGRLTSLRTEPDADNAVEDAWYGVAVPSKEGAFSVSATTETSKLHLYRPGRSGDAEIFRTNLLVRLFSDPSVAFISVMFAVLTILLQTLTGLFSLRRSS